MGALVDIKVPDIGDFTDVEVIEVMVKPGDAVRVDDSLITIESDKASMEVPATAAGVVKEIKVQVGDKVSEGSPIVVLETAAGDAAATQTPPAQTAAKPALSVVPSAPKPARPAAGAQPSAANAAAGSADGGPRSTASGEPPAAPKVAPRAPAAPAVAEAAEEHERKPHASPAVRKFARELGVDLQAVRGTGLNGRIFRTDVQNFVKSAIVSPSRPSGGALELAPWPKVDFAKFGEIETRPLSRIRRLSRTNLARNWAMIPHVTQFDETDVTELEALRHELTETHVRDGVRVTLLAFVLKALVSALGQYPEFNSSLEGDNLILRKYFHFGFAADTPEGLVVPVVRDVDKKGVLQIARETAALAQAAREGKLKLADIQGGCFTVSSLGGVGGTAFTPIINAPEVAILGLSRVARKPVWRDGAFVPRLMLPLSLSYDHRVIDGALAARFITSLGAMLTDMRRALL